MPGTSANPNPFSALVVDDDEFVRNVVVRQLRMLGAHSVAIADNGQSAREVLSLGHPLSLIVCDLMMPGTDGIELIRNIAETNPGVALLLISSADPKILRSAQELAERRQLRVLGCLGKPVRIQALRSLLEDLDRTSPTLPRKPQQRIDEGQLRDGLARGEFAIEVQPQLCLHAPLRLSGAEALVRWHSPALGLVMPDLFLPLVAGHGLLDPLTDVVLRAAIDACSDWRRQGLALRIAVNFNPSTLIQRDLPERVMALTAAAGLPAAAVIIEVTEQDIACELGDPLEALTRLRLRDVELSIDDFGTGHSSLERLRSTPFTELKIDRRFTANAGHDMEARHIVESNIRLAHDLGLRAVAEGVETAADLELMAQLGCDVAQGYHIARPMRPEKLVAWARDQGLSACCGQLRCPWAVPGKCAGKWGIAALNGRLPPQAPASAGAHIEAARPKKGI